MFRRMCLMAVLLLVATPIVAAESVEPEGKLATVKKAVVAKLHDLGDTFKVKKVEPNRWASIQQGVKDIEERIAEIRRTIQEIQVKGQTAMIDQAEFDRQLAEIQAEFNRLAEEAGTETGLPEPLAKSAAQESITWRNWATVTVGVKDVYGKALDRMRNQTAYFKRLDPMLARLDRGAKNVSQLATVLNRVDQLDKLTQMAEQINQIIGIFDALADQTKSAVAQIEGGNSNQRVVEPTDRMAPVIESQPETRPQMAYGQNYQTRPSQPAPQTYRPAVQPIPQRTWTDQNGQVWAVPQQQVANDGWRSAR